MKIGIDARALVGNKTGIGHYLEQILRIWAKSDNNYDYFLFAHRDFQLPDELERMNKVILAWRPGTLWMQYAVPYLLARQDIDLFWGPNYSIPLIRPARTKTVITIHDMVSYVYPDTLPAKTVFHNRFGLPLYVHNVNRIITESESTKKDIVKFLDFSSSRIDITLLGVNERFFRRTADSNEILKKHDITFPYLLSVGTVEPRKNLVGVIEAYSRLIKEHFIEHRLVVVGAKGWKYSGIYDMLDKQPELKDRICFLGYVPDEDLPAIYQGASVFVYPSFYEGFGLPPLEAMASGIPVVASNVSSLPEVIGDAGILVSPDSVEELSNALKRILFQPELAQTFVNMGIERARTFTWERTAEQTLAVFEQVMNEGSR